MDGLGYLEENLTSASLKAALNDLMLSEIEVQLPKFTMQNKLTLSEVLSGIRNDRCFPKGRGRPVGYGRNT